MINNLNLGILLASVFEHRTSIKYVPPMAISLDVVEATLVYGICFGFNTNLTIIWEYEQNTAHGDERSIAIIPRQ